MKTKKVTPTALEQARVAFDQLVKLSTRNLSAKPKETVKRFAVAVLPSGNLLMSNGQIRTSSAIRQVSEVRGKAVQGQQAPAAGKTQGQRVTEDLSLQVAIPASQMGTGTNRAMALANYLNQVLQPRMASQPAFGRLTYLPQPEAMSTFYTPSAIANLPPLVRRVEDVLRSQMGGRFIEDTQRLQKQMAETFLRRFMIQGERPAAYATMGGLGAAPRLTQEYETKNFYVPANKAAETAQVKPQTPSISQAYIY